MSAATAKTAGIEIEYSSQRLRHLLNSTPSVIYSTRAFGDFACTFVNDNVYPVLGYSKQEMLASANFWYDHLNPRDRNRVIEEFNTQVAKGGGALEYRFRCKDGRYVWIYDSHRLIVDDRGGPLEIVGSWTDITQRRKLSEQLDYESTRDSLTGLINRREFEKRLDNFLSSAQERKYSGALCYFDLDQFKVINDAHGHMAGDQMLREIGQALQKTTRARDTLARVGGDEFALILEHCSMDDAKTIANNIRKQIESYRFQWGNDRHRIGASIGVTQIDAQSGTVNEILKRADSACFLAKEAGRNRVYIYRDDDRNFEQRHKEMGLVAEVNSALEEDRFELHAQVIAPTKKVDIGHVHYEILLRMRDTKGALVAPGIFLGAAERYGLSTLIDEWVVRSAIGFLQAQSAHVTKLSMCSINLSGHSLGDADFINHIEKMVGNSGLPPHKLCFEITETAAVSNIDAAKRLINRLRDLGCRFALDDFGTGFSSFAYLGQLPIDFLKIDGAFIKDICTNPVHEVFVRAINDIGHVMNLETIAEFVEDDTIRSKLERIGVDYVQGYGIGKPQPINSVLKL